MCEGVKGGEGVEGDEVEGGVFRLGFQEHEGSTSGQTLLPSPIRAFPTPSQNGETVEPGGNEEHQPEHDHTSDTPLAFWAAYLHQTLV